jgi:ABC-type uncharacterized transport system fused permease/ATPase subunit
LVGECRDQRIHIDVDNFTNSLSLIVTGVITAPMTIGYYTYWTWKVIAWYAPMIVTGYFLVSYVLNKIIMGPIVRRIFRQEKLEGSLESFHRGVHESNSF